MNASSAANANMRLLAALLTGYRLVCSDAAEQDDRTAVRPAVARCAYLQLVDGSSLPKWCPARRAPSPHACGRVPQAFTRTAQLEPDNGDAWNNIAVRPNPIITLVSPHYRLMLLSGSCGTCYKELKAATAKGMCFPFIADVWGLCSISSFTLVDVSTSLVRDAGGRCMLTG